MQPREGSATSASGGSVSMQPRLASAGGLSFREVGDWFKNLGDDIGNIMGLPRSRTMRRAGPHAGLSGRALSDLGGVQPRLPSTSILAKQQQVGGRRGGRLGCGEGAVVALLAPRGVRLPAVASCCPNLPTPALPTHLRC